MLLEGVREADVEVQGEPGERLPTRVGVKARLRSTLRDQPLVSTVGDIVDVVLVVATAVEPLRVTSFFDAELVRLELPHEFKRSQWAASVEGNLACCRVSCLVYLGAIVGRRSLVGFGTAKTDPPNPPRTGSFLGATQLGSSSDKGGALPSPFPVELVGRLFLDPVNVLS